MKAVKFRMCYLSSYTTTLLEIEADHPKFHVLFIPGNPGVIAFYKDFLESLFVLLGEVASVTGIGHISCTEMDWENGRLFSLQEQIDHKVDFIQNELQNVKVPVVLVGHSIGSYISLEMLRRCKEKVIYCIALYPFLTLNPKSSWQHIIGRISASSTLSAIISFIVALLGMLLPVWALRLIMFKAIGKSCSATAVEAACSHLVQYHVMRNVLFMTMTEFQKLSEPPDWTFMMENKDKVTFLFGDDDHWAPILFSEEISKQVPGISLSIEREGHNHCFCCSETGSLWVARHVACLIQDQIFGPEN